MRRVWPVIVDSVLLAVVGWFLITLLRSCLR